MIEQDLAQATWDFARASGNTKPVQHLLSMIRNIKDPALCASAFDKAAEHWSASDRLPALSPTQSENHYMSFVEAAAGTPSDKVTGQLDTVVKLFGQTKMQPVKLKSAVKTLLTMHDSIRDSKFDAAKAERFSASFVRQLAKTTRIIEPNARANVREKNIAQADTLEQLIPRLPVITENNSSEGLFDSYRAVAKSLGDYANRRGSSPAKAEQLNTQLQHRCDSCSPEAANMLRYASPEVAERPLPVFTSAGREWSYPTLGPKADGTTPDLIQITISDQD
ncbi:hypothetical protein FJU08_03780 [Martelella alba]|uniref:Uncharacterized protein n=1 Tax=Martelella alba TaxID=2590451 RepID=A0A506UCH9_9HYPH|nr:hypothetical protein [Martelella alba]TPW32142.1 hypothetical protein FJU08_03780 [Martelella alba]